MSKPEQQQIVVFLDKELHRKLKLYAFSKGITMTQELRSILEEKLSNIVVNEFLIESVKKES